MPMDCVLDQQQMCLRLTGEIDHHRAGQLMRELEQQIDLESPGVLELDLGGVTFMDSSGIALVLKAHRMLAITGGKLRLVRVPPQPGRVLHCAGLDRLFTITPL